MALQISSERIRGVLERPLLSANESAKAPVLGASPALSRAVQLRSIGFDRLLGCGYLRRLIDLGGPVKPSLFVRLLIEQSHAEGRTFAAKATPLASRTRLRGKALRPRLL